MVMVPGSALLRTTRTTAAALLLAVKAVTIDTTYVHVGRFVLRDTSAFKREVLFVRGFSGRERRFQQSFLLVYVKIVGY